MKKICIVFLFSLLTLSFSSGSFAGDRMILIERFTSSTCGPCASNNPTMDAFLSSQDPSKIRGISYHMSWPAPGNDPMYLANTSDNNTRRTYYNVNAIPQARFDGYITLNSPYNSSSLQSYYNSRIDVLSPVTLVVTESIVGNTVNVRVDVYCEMMMQNPSAIIQLAVVEKLVQYSSPPGTNGETQFHDVMRKMLPSAAGTSITLFPGKVTTIEYTYDMDPNWQADQIQNIVFIQAPDKEIINAAVKTSDFNLISAPAFKVVNQGQSQNANYKIKIPHVASGFNSAVNFSAVVDPPVSGVSVSFPNGNTINNFPDSIDVQVTSTSSVPSGEYKVILTGTSLSGKTHKTVVNYLVGQNYVYTASSRLSSTYKIDGITYNSPKVFNWELDSQHNLEAISPQVFNSYQYVFNNWSNGGPSTQTVTVSSDISEYTVDYNIQFKIFANILPAGIPVNIIGGNLYYDSSSTANLSVNPTQIQHNGKNYYFQGWLGVGGGSYTGPDPNPAIVINNTVIQTAVFDTIDVGISNYSSEIPDKYNLYQNYPNPFNPVTKVKFDIPSSSLTSLTVYDNLGREVAVLVNEVLNPGKYEYSFNAVNLPSGVYFYRIEAGNFVQINKMVLLK
jgi:hypothetical protein